MNLTARLSSEQYQLYRRGLIAIGAPIEACIETETLFADQTDDAGGWYRRLTRPATPTLAHLNHNRYAFCGQVQDRLVEQDDLDIYYFVLLDCGAPISLLVSDLNADAGSGDLGDHSPDPGAWLSGVAHLSLTWPEDLSSPVAQAVYGTVAAIQRLTLRPGPGFGELREELDLPMVPLAPDQVYLTLKLSDAW